MLTARHRHLNTTSAASKCGLLNDFGSLALAALTVGAAAWLGPYICI